MNRLRLYCFYLLFLITPAFCSPKNNTTSIIIPCHYKHAIWLPSLLDTFAQQTVLPNEIVISLSEYTKVNPDLLQNLCSNRWPFTIQLLTCEEPISEGGNRNRACRHATGDVFICHDADDIPHPQRVEIIKFFFDNLPIDHLMHYYTHDASRFRYFSNIAEIKWGYGDDRFTANGPIAMTRRVFDKVQWVETFQVGNDVLFNDEVYRHFADSAICIQEYIYLYRPLLTSYSQ